MGQEFCQGCRDCTNNNPEENLTKQGNIPITNINNPFFFNNKTNNSGNEMTQINNESFLNNYNHNKNESIITSINVNENEEYNKLKNNNNAYSELTPTEKERLKEIKKNIYSRKITNLLRKNKELLINAHQKLCKEYTTISSSEFILDLNKEDLDVNLAPEINCLYLGTKYNNDKDGLGLEIFEESKSKYFGIFKGGRRFQVGKFTINNENQDYSYYGQIKGIYASGYGWFEDRKNVKSYEGMWENSMKNGEGIEYYQDQSEYCGTFLNGKKNGIGYYKWPDGSSYEGNWKENKLDGYGIYTFKDGSIYKGEWKGNRMNGIGEFTSPGEKTYIGYFERDIRNGFGMVIWHKVKKGFIGFWKDNHQDGLGKFIVNNKIRYGFWKEGEIIEKIKSKNEFDQRLYNGEQHYSAFFQIEDYDTFSQYMNQYMIE